MLLQRGWKAWETCTDATADYHFGEGVLGSGFWMNQVRFGVFYFRCQAKGFRLLALLDFWVHIFVCAPFVCACVPTQYYVFCFPLQNQIPIRSSIHLSSRTNITVL